MKNLIGLLVCRNNWSGRRHFMQNDITFFISSDADLSIREN